MVTKYLHSFCLVLVPPRKTVPILDKKDGGKDGSANVCVLLVIGTRSKKRRNKEDCGRGMQVKGHKIGEVYSAHRIMAR